MDSSKQNFFLDLENRYSNIRRYNRGKININPLQTAGKLTSNAEKALVEFGDGYSVCDFCKGTVEQIENPPIKHFLEKDLPEFIGADFVRITHGAREGKERIFRALTKPGDIIILDENRHYSTDAAIQSTGLKEILVKNDGKDTKMINVKDYVPLIEQYNPSLIFLTYPDGTYGNLSDAKRLAEIAKKYNIPFIINGAYAIGRMPINMKELGADFIIGSGHKSMASSGPIGVLGFDKKWENKMTEKVNGHEKKEIGCLGCSVRGAPIITLMASFPEVYKRVQDWSNEVEKARWFSKEMEKLGLVQQGQKPHNHDLMYFKTDIFYEISNVHPKKRGFLYEKLKENGIVGVKHGVTKFIKISTFGIQKDDLKKVLNVFNMIIENYKNKKL
ncbi:MAG: O-phospho-L-seryl-tRNA:Cys-tRNA synthase [Candidatus Nanoarchaeia archaeon]|nr:O-phospho-L-seryl-tRNA:Cys-tRNA synthase [Candidatus Nanoarchaeia archaeon]